MIRFLLAAAIVFQTATDGPAPLFRTGVDVVRLAAVVRDSHGRFVRDLKASEFEVFDGGRLRPIKDFRQEVPGLSVAMLFDVSGSMEGQLVHAREAASLLLANLDPARDEAAVFRFDTSLHETAPFTLGLRQLPASMSKVVPFGATSLYDAIARTAERVSAREGRRHAVVVFTDGFDNASKLTGPQVSGIASSIDVPVYIVGVVSPLDDPTSDAATPSAAHSPLAGALANLAAWTGGGTFVASTPAQRSIVARQILDELRHQYLIAIESATEPGWHRLTVKLRNKDLAAHARSGYFVGHARAETQ
ncbi:MAG TPA: VWA domain-containing protein [Vicinamibacterales bacterium]|nr:VWA domain-containing protein [Vicinamibacterales bacterium]